MVDPFARWGQAVVRLRWFIVATWMVVLVGAGTALAPRLGNALQAGGFLVPDSESTQAAEVLDRAFDGANRNNLSILFRAGSATVDDDVVRDEITQVEARLAALPGVRHIDSYYQTGTPLLVSRDRHSAITVVTLDGTESDIEARVADVRAALAAVHLEHYVTGQPASNIDVRQASQSDLRHAEMVTLPIVAVLLVLVFRTLVASAIPLLLGGASVVLALAAMYLLTFATDISIFALNTASMVGLGLGVDFSLIVVSRFNEELDKQGSPHAAVVATMASAGRSIAYSGVTVFAGMLVLTLLFDLLVVRSMSLAVMLVAGTGVVAGLTLLPAVLAILGHRIRWARVVPELPATRTGRGTWYRFSRVVMHRPWVWLAYALAVLAVLAMPVLDLGLMGVAPGGLPQPAESSQGVMAVSQDFGPNRLEPIQIVLSTSERDGIWTPTFLTGLQRLSSAIAADPRVDSVLSLSTAAQAAGVPPSIFPSLTSDLLRSDPKRAAQASRLVNLDGGGTDANITVYVRTGAFDDDHQALVHDIRERIVPSISELRPDRVLVGGLSAGVEDYADALYSRFPLLVAVVLAVTFVILSLLFRSVVLPLKAIVLNAMSIVATYGAVVLIFEDGWGANLIGLEPQGKLFVVTPALLFVILFGLSTDYEVFMLSRVAERFRETGDNEESVASGLGHTARVITAAGLVLVATFASFGVSQLIFLKELGIGLAIGVLLDTTVVRLVLVPASMRLMGRANWYWPSRWVPRRRIAVVGSGLTMLLLAACGPRPTASGSALAASVPPAIAISAEPVRLGDIQQTQSLSGEIRAREQVSVLPKTAGRVERVLVDVGASVKAGDVLAELDQDSPRVQLQQAQAALAAASAKLAQLDNGPRSEDVAAAEAALNVQQIKLHNMRSGGRPEDIQLAQAALDGQQAKLDLMGRGGRPEVVQQAQDALDAAQARLAALQKGAPDDLRQATESAVASDKAALASAEAAFAALGASNAADLQAVRSQVDSLRAQVQAAQSAVDSADAALKNLTGSSAADVQQAQSSLDAATAQRAAAQAALDATSHPTPVTLAQARAAVQQATAQRQQAEAQQAALERKVGPPCAPVILPSGQRLAADDNACGVARAAATAAVDAANAGLAAAQAQLDQVNSGGAPSQRAQLVAALNTTEAQVKAARARLDAITSGGTAAQRAQLEAQKQQALSQLQAAQNSLRTAEARLDAVSHGSLDAQVKASQAQVTAARERLKADQAHLDQMVGGPSDEDLQQAQSAVDQASQQVTLATSPSTPEELRAQRAAVAQARLQLQKARQPFTSFDLQQQEQAVAQAQAMLDKAEHPFTDQDRDAAQAAVDQANAQVAQAQLSLSYATVVAPVDGRVADRLVAPGALVGPTTPIVTLVPPALELIVNVEESQLGNLADGQVVQFSVPAVADATFNGAVSSIAPSVDARTRTAAVRIQPDDPAGRLRAGMSATASIVTALHRGTLLVPRAAVKSNGRDGPPTLLVIDDDSRVRLQPVRLGLQTDDAVEIIQGLDEGERVATSNLTNLQNGDLVAPHVAPPTTASTALSN